MCASAESEARERSREALSCYITNVLLTWKCVIASDKGLMWPPPKDASRPPLIAPALGWRDGGEEKDRKNRRRRDRHSEVD